MQILISCAKDMSSYEEVMKTYGLEEGEMGAWPASLPSFWKDAVITASEMAEMNAADISHLLKCSGDIGELNQLRFSQFSDMGDISRQKVSSSRDPFKEMDWMSYGFLQAAMAYSGVAFKHLRAAEWSREEMVCANGHLWIMSFMYGLLRPMDLILPYRMEGNVKLRVHGGRSMFDWWRERLTETLIQSIREDDGTLLWCSTEEMKRMVDWKRLVEEVEVFLPDFLVRKGDHIKTMSVYAKMCRGAMTRKVIRDTVSGRWPGDGIQQYLESFEYEGFHHADGMKFIKEL